MNKINTVFSALFLLSLISVSGQNGILTGVVFDKMTNDRIPFANIAVYNEDLDMITGSTSNDNGKFKIENLDTGKYQVLVSFIGYTMDTLSMVTLVDEKSHINVGHVYLNPAHVEIAGVEVRAMARTSAKKIDRQTYRPGDFETASGGTAIDVLNKLPSVSVDPDGTVLVRGTSDFMVYLNGKPTQMEASVLLGQISANSIENIDVITVPTARYDAQGKGGIINI